MLDGCDDLECELALKAGSWIGSHGTRGLTYRQVPVPGIDSKWLQNKRRCERLEFLSNKEDLGLVGWPSCVEFAYLDPAHSASGGRHYNSWVYGDASHPPYQPQTVIIVENKDTYLCFPELVGGSCVFRAGYSGASTVGQLPWIQSAQRIVYWGDLNADGFEILNSYRAGGLACSSILMDVETPERLGRYDQIVAENTDDPKVFFT